LKRNLSIALVTLLLAALACNFTDNIPFSNVETGPTESFTINELATSGASTTNVRLGMAASSATLVLAGGASVLAEGEIRYNVADWEPTLSTSNGTLSIVQEVPDEEVHSISGNAVNEWDLKLGSGLLDVLVECPAGDFTLNFASTLPDGVAITVDMGAGNLRLVVPEGIAANVQVSRGPSTVTTEGAWTKNGSSYLNGGSGSAWAIDIDMGVGNLTLASQ
jgi:hypothetical protein